jgi:cytochrome d ubiquinol oxidase subunit I
VLGPLLGYEVLTAFFLEASFLGIMLFGWNRVSRKMHFAATVIVAAGTLISAFWILSANSWMQTPAGLSRGRRRPALPHRLARGDFQSVISLPFVHMITAAYLTTAFVVGGIGGYYLWRGLHVKHARSCWAWP